MQLRFGFLVNDDFVNNRANTLAVCLADLDYRVSIGCVLEGAAMLMPSTIAVCFPA